MYYVYMGIKEKKGLENALSGYNVKKTAIYSYNMRENVALSLPGKSLKSRILEVFHERSR